MGFDNECILNIQSLAGEYFCPVCRLLVYPNEALQSQCTHLYCKPCLTYIVSTTRACPYDGYLVTEADSKPLIESNKALAETIGKISVHCLYHRSGCTWQGQFSECTTHCDGCAFGNSPVVCNRCGTQIVHCQVQEHAQNCPGVQPQAQQAEGDQNATTVSAEQNHSTTQAGALASQSQPAQIVAAPPPSQDQSQARINSQPQGAGQTIPTLDQSYQQHYQQYYQQYPGYGPHQQHYQHYDPHAQQQYQQQHLQTNPRCVMQGAHQTQAYMQPQPQTQAQVPAHSQPQSQSQPHAHSQPPSAVQPPVQAQVSAQQQLQPTVQLHPQKQPQTQPSSHGHQHPQLYPQAQLHPPQSHVQPHLQQHPNMPQHQQPLPQISHPQPHSQPQAPSQSQLHPQPLLQCPPHMQPQHQGQHPSAHSVTGHRSYPQFQPLQQVPPGAPQRIPMHMHSQQQGVTHQLPQGPQHTVQMQGQFPQQLPQMHSPQSHAPKQLPQQLPQPPHVPLLPPQGLHSSLPPAQQQLVHPHPHQPGQPMHQHLGMHPPQQQPVPQQQAHGQLHHPHSFPQQTPGLVHNQSHLPVHLMQQQQALQPQSCPQGPQVSLQQHGHPQVQQNVTMAHAMLPHQSQNHAGQPTGHSVVSNHGLSHKPFQQSSGEPAHGKPTQSSAIQQSLNKSYLPRNIHPQSSSEQQLGYVQHSSLLRSSGGTVLQPALPASLSETNIQASSMQAAMKSKLEAEAASQKTDSKEADGLRTTSSKGAASVGLKIPRSESDLKSLDDEGKSVKENEIMSNQPNYNVKEISESSQAWEKDTANLPQEDDSEETLIKLIVKQEATSNSEPSTGEITTKDQEDFSHCGPKQDGNSLLEDKEIQDHPLQNNLPSQQTEALEGKDVKMQTEMANSKMACSGLDAGGGPMKAFPGVDRGSQAVSQSIGSVPSRTGQNVIPQGHVPGSERNGTQALPVPRDTFQQSIQQNLVPTHERLLPQPGYHERNFAQPQFPHQGPGRMQANNSIQPGHVVSVPDNQQLPIHYGTPPMQDRAHQGSLIPGQMLQPSMPPPNQMPVPGKPPVHMRPHGQNLHGNLPPQGQPSIMSEHFRPPISKQHQGSFHPEVPLGSFIGVGPSASFGRGPSHLGPSHRGFEMQPSDPQGHHHQGYMLPAHAAGPRIQSDPVQGPALGGPHPGAFDSQGGMVARGPPHGSEGHIGQLHPNPMDAEMFANKKPGYIDGRHPDLLLPGSAEHVPFGRSSGIQSNNTEITGCPVKAFTGGVPDASFPFGLQEERFKPLPKERSKKLREEGFNPPQGEHFKPFSMERNRQVIDQKEFVGDLKHFPRPAHLDAEPVAKFESYFSLSKSLDREPHGFNHEVGIDGSTNAGSLRFLPPYQPGGLRSIGFRNDIMGSAIDPVGVHPDFLRSVSESGRPRMDGLPLLRSPGREYPGIPSSRFGRLEDIDGRESHFFGERSRPFNHFSDGNAFHESTFPILPNYLRRREREQIGSGALPVHSQSGDLVGHEIPPIHLRSGELLGPHNFSGHLSMGEPSDLGVFPNHLRVREMGGRGNLPSNLRIGESIGGNLPSHAREPGFSGSLPIHGYPNDSGLFNVHDVESFDHSRKRKPGSTGWCRICKIDCETVEGLDMHSQTKEHQKMVMDMVLKIKKENAKRQKLSSDDHISREDANKSRKASFESHEN